MYVLLIEIELTLSEHSSVRDTVLEERLDSALNLE